LGSVTLLLGNAFLFFGQACFSGVGLCVEDIAAGAGIIARGVGVTFFTGYKKNRN